MKKSRNKVVILTGASRGIGHEIAAHLDASGQYFVYATMRNPERDEEWSERVHVKTTDVTDEASCHTAVREILAEHGRVDILINNAGQGVFGPAETVKIEQVQELFDINVLGPLRMIQAVLPAMREQREGRILNISSLGGFRPGPCLDAYTTTKFALEGLSESLAASLLHWNIFVSLIEPGPVATAFVQSSLTEGTRFEGRNNPYEPLMKNTMKYLSELLSQGQSPEEIAQLVMQVIAADKPSIRYQTSPEGKNSAAAKFVDITGNKLVEQQSRMLEELWR